MKKVVTIEQMRALERDAAARGLPGPALMENAGRAVADEISARFPSRGRRHVLVLVGPGNNGGDGLVAARFLRDAGFSVLVYLINRQLGKDAKIDLLTQRGVHLMNLADDLGLLKLETALRETDLILDAVLGTGRARPLTGAVADILDRVNRHSAEQSVVALDLPTGLNADTGQADPHALRADLTVTLGEPKRGLLLGDGVDLAGAIVVADIGIPEVLAASLPIDYADAAAISRLLPRRPRASHKGSFGRVMIVAGSAQYAGAPVLAALAAERVGAGLVTVACPASIRGSLAAHTIETTFLPLPDAGSGEFVPTAVEPLIAALGGYAAILVGPGIGRSTATSDFLEQLLARLRDLSLPAVFDADALTLLSHWPRWWERLPPAAILTPHAGEMARLIGSSPAASGAEDRIDQALDAARSWNTTVVLKGPYTVIARPDGKATVLPFAVPALATAGTGDVLAGTILGLLGQGLALADAALVGGFVQGTAGEILMREVGPAGGLAGDLAQKLPKALDSIRLATD